jgi:magnesium transporter
MIKVTSQHIRTLLSSGNTRKIERLIKKLHPVDIAEMLKQLNTNERSRFFGLIPPAMTFGVLDELDDAVLYDILKNMDSEKAAALINRMSYDEVVDFISMVPRNITSAWLSHLTVKDRNVIRSLLNYPPNTAGGIMTTEFLAFVENITASEVMEKLPQIAPDVETIYYIYVIEKSGKLIGVLSLRDLILSPPDRIIKEIMSEDVKAVNVDTDQEEVALMIRKYGFLGLPVVDNDNKLLGIITVDDVMDVVEEEATEDIFKLSGRFDDVGFENTRPLQRAIRRLPWLLIALFGELISAKFIQGFSPVLEAVVALTFFIPVLMGMGGNVGTQSTAIVVRGIATGKIDRNRIGKNLLHETLVGLTLGAVCGIVVAVVAVVWQRMPMLGVVVGLAMWNALTVAAIIGTLVPLVLSRLGRDPAVASGPFVTTTLDITGLFIYFSSAALFFKTLI